MTVEDAQNPRHPEGLTPEQEMIADGLFQIGAIKFGYYKLDYHREHREAPLSPIYIDMKMVRRSPDIKMMVVHEYEGILAGLNFDLLADIPTGITPVVATLSDRLSIGHITPRTEIKDHGTGKKVDGMLESDRGKTAAVVDDVITKGTSKVRAIAILEAEDIRVTDVVVLVDREQAGDKELALKGYRLHSVMKISQLLDYYLRTGKIDQAKHQEIKAYLAMNT